MTATLRNLAYICLLIATCDVTMAQQNPLIGAWSTSVADASGKPSIVGYLEFRPDGGVRLKGYYRGGSEPVIETGTYRLDSSRSRVVMIFTGYHPKQCVVVLGRNHCEPPPMNINQPISRGFQFTDANTLRFSDGAEYRRAPAIP